ncbi:MAG: T9SS type A sorting domain-containing protein [Bacteroidales bacterium]
MKTKFYTLKVMSLLALFVAGGCFSARAQIVGEISYRATHDTDIGSGHDNTDVGHKTQIRMANTTLTNPASYDTYIKFNVKDSLEIPEGMKILSAKLKVSTTINGGPLMPDFAVLHVANDNWNEDATIPIEEAPDYGVEYSDTLDRTSFTGGNASMLCLNVTQALLDELEAEDEFMTIRIDNLAESFYAAGSRDIEFVTDTESWMYGWTPPMLHVYYGHQPDSIFSEVDQFGNIKNYTTFINSADDKRYWYNEVGIWIVAENEGDKRLHISTRPAPINGTPGGYALYAGETYGDFDFNLKAKLNKTTGGALDPRADFIIVFGYKGLLDYSYLRLTGEDINGFYVVDTTDGGSETVVGELNTTPAVSDTLFHSYRVVRTGSSVTAYIDDVEYMSVDDPLLGNAGQFGIGSYNDVAFFDDIQTGAGEPISVNEPSGLTARVFPNPASNVLYVTAESEIQAVSIQNILGQQVREIGNIRSGSVRLGISDLEPGIYFIRIETGEYSHDTRKIVIK